VGGESESLEQSNAACCAITVHCLNGGVERYKRHFPVRIPTCSTDYFCRESWSQRKNFASFPTINRQAMNALAAAEIRFADRKQKVEFQPALLVPKQIISPSITLCRPSQTLPLYLLHESSCVIPGLFGSIALWLPSIQSCRRLFAPSSPTFDLFLPTSEVSLIHNGRL
jgi:hypothetical protein